jgi:hypothetical protein
MSQLETFIDQLAVIRRDETARVDAVRAMGSVPAMAGNPDAVQIVDAPARGVVVVPGHDLITGERVAKGFDGLRPLVRADAIDRMRAASKRRGGSLALTSAQIGMGRTYGGLVERHAAGAVRCSSIEGHVDGGGGDAAGFFQARIDAARVIERLEANVGRHALATRLRRQRPPKRGGGLSVRALDLVQAVFVSDLTVSEYLDKIGWSKGPNVAKGIASLGDAIDAMIGPLTPHRMAAAHYGAAHSSGRWFEKTS